MVCFLSGKDFDLQLAIEHGRSGLMVDRRGILIVRYGQVKWMQQHQQEEGNNRQLDPEHRQQFIWSETCVQHSV